MVIDAILTWWFDLVKGMVSAFPQQENPMSTFNFSMITDINYFLPIEEMFSLFIVFFALGGPFLYTSLIVWWFVGVLRGGSTKA